MLVARAGEEIVCPRGTLCGRMIRNAHDQIVSDDFVAPELRFSPADRQYVCACCGSTVAADEGIRWRVHLRRGWVR